jgi:hypothetical protein
MFNDSFSAGLSRITNAQTRSISAENPTGAPGCGGMATEGTGANCARELGRGWKVSPSKLIRPGETLTLADIDGEGVIQSIWFAGSTDRGLTFRIYWDDLPAPSVEAPLPAFFAYGYNNNIDGVTGRFPFLNSALVMVAPNRGMNCFFEMPFRKHCRMTLENTTSHDCVTYFQINYALCKVPDDAGYFCAQYRQARPVEGADYTIIDGIEGKGQYIGTSLAVGLNAAGGWWGEGEIKFFMDDDGEFPTICGTGTEDYFGGAYDWDVNGSYQTYSGLYMGMYQVIQPDRLYSSQQRFLMYRWHVVDPVRFEKSLRVTMQDLGWRSDGRYLARRDDFMSVAYWYQDKPAQNFPPFPTPNDVEIV